MWCTICTVPVLNYLEYEPELDGEVVIAEDAYVVGKVSLKGPAVLESSAVIRGDQASVTIGSGFYMGRSSTIHVDPGNPTVIGQSVWLGERVVVHGCKLGDMVRVEDRGIVLSRSEIGSGSIVAAGALVTEGAIFPANSYIAGSPGRSSRATTVDERRETSRRVRG